MSYRKLRGRIVEKYGTIDRFASVLGKTRQCVSKKLNNRSDFSKADMDEWSQLLDIKVKDVGSYFFTQDVTKA